MNQAARGPAPPLEQKSEDSPEDKIRQLEKKVNELIEESCMANSRGEFQTVSRGQASPVISGRVGPFKLGAAQPL